MDTAQPQKEDVSKQPESFATPKKELAILSTDPFTFEMNGRQVTLRPICLEDMDKVAETIFGLVAALDENDAINWDELVKSIMGNSIIILKPIRRALVTIIANQTEQTEEFIVKLPLADISILFRAFAEQNHLEIIVENFLAVVTRIKEAAQNLTPQT